jgi:CRP-like cAMP-binding protein
MTPSPTDPDVLSELTLFQGVPAQELEKFAPLLHRKIFPAGATVITADQPGDAVYVISAGSVKVHVIRPDGEEVILAVLGPGEVVGEMSLADSLGRSADVSTLEESVLLWMHRSAFRTKLEEVPMLSRNLASLLSRRVGSQTPTCSPWPPSTCQDGWPPSFWPWHASTARAPPRARAYRCVSPRAIWPAWRAPRG